jgi:hypothetical protein
MAWNGDWKHLLDNYKFNEEIYDLYNLEQKYTISKLKKENVNIKSINKEFNGIYSYKHHCRHNLPNDAKVVLFHGKPRPHKIKDGWVIDYYPYNAVNKRSIS